MTNPPKRLLWLACEWRSSKSRMAGPTADLITKFGGVPVPLRRSGRFRWVIAPRSPHSPTN